ncbi:MAG: hypothetical protein C0475_00205 [Planctomyces sp.]|nr:hypothetical protein [Planctomyces sp.]MBA4119350.1 hypothetical protein [Isosphaera sp.]
MHTRRAQRQSLRPNARRGVTLLEVLLATVMMAGIAGAVSSVMFQITRSEERQRRARAGHELANRLILQFLDDESQLPDDSLPYNDGNYLFRWELEVIPAKIEPPPRAVLQPRATAPAAPGGAAQRSTRLTTEMELIVARVWLGVPDGVGGAARGDRLAELRRLRNPIDITRNIDSASRLDPSQLTQSLLGRLSGGAQERRRATGSGSSAPGNRVRRPSEDEDRP